MRDASVPTGQPLCCAVRSLKLLLPLLQQLLGPLPARVAYLSPRVWVGPVGRGM